ncbi:MAG: UDP-N-acetylmuramate dehydrogenase [Propionibacteriaceae bacterium]|nr:UDP-N-acetylmuramate dehydrogenase [Propionibacteriaceae bacterium]
MNDGMIHSEDTEVGTSTARERRTVTGSTRLADHTTFRIGGPADRLVVARTEADLIDAVRAADAQSIPVLILSGGSNVLIADEGFRGTVVIVGTQGVDDVTDHATAPQTDCGPDLAPRHVIRVAAGEPWDALVATTVSRRLGGLEMLSGIPGLAGAAPIQNIGAYGAEIASVIERVRTWDRRDACVTTWSAEECRFGYRTSVFKREPGRHVVLSVDLRLDPSGSSAPIAYAELARRLGVDAGTRLPVEVVRETVLDLRRGKGMVLDDSDHDTWSAGSFFTNPLVNPAVAAALPEDAPRFPTSDDRVKTSAAWLIEHAGFHKGYGDHVASLSTKHVLALTNRGGATARDVITLARRVRDGVLATYGIQLEPEPVLVGLGLDETPADTRS